MKYTLRIILLAGSVFLLFGQADIVDLGAQTITAEDIYESFIYEDYVVEGVVLSVKQKRIPLRQFFTNVSNPYLRKEKQVFMIIELALRKVLIGNLGKDEITLYGLNASDNCLYEIKEGDIYIFPLRHKYYEGYICNMDGDKERYYKGVLYGIMSQDRGRFLIDDGNFKRGFELDPIQKGKTKDLYRAIGEIRKKRSIESITAQAEVIARGKIKSKWTTKDTLSSGFSKNIVRMKLEIDDCFKGDTGSDELEFSVIYRPYYEPFWRAEVPHVNVGEDWLVFLKWAEEPGYYPFAGVNGIFKIEDDKLIRDNRIVMKKKIQDVKSIIMQEMSGGDQDAK